MRHVNLHDANHLADCPMETAGPREGLFSVSDDRSGDDNHRLLSWLPSRRQPFDNQELQQGSVTLLVVGLAAWS